MIYCDKILKYYYQNLLGRLLTPYLPFEIRDPYGLKHANTDQSKSALHSADFKK